MALNAQDRNVIIGVCVALGVLIIAAVIVCICTLRRNGRRKKRSLGVEEGKSKIVDDDLQSVEPQVTETDGYDNKVTEDETHVMDKEIKKKDDSADLEAELISDNDNLGKGEIAELYSTVDKSAKVSSKGTTQDIESRHEGNAELELPEAFRNSPDGAADINENTREKLPVTDIDVVKVITTEEDRVTNTNNNSALRSDNADQVFVDEDITKIPSDGRFVHINHEISFSSGDEDRSSVSSRPSVSFQGQTFHSDYDHLKVKTTKTTSKAWMASPPEEGIYDVVGSPRVKTTRIIPPDPNGMARVYVSPNAKSQTTPILHQKRMVGTKSLERLNAGHLQEFPVTRRFVEPPRARNDQAVLNSWGTHSLDSRQMRQYPDRMVHHGQRFEHGDNISMRTDGGYPLTQYTLPASKRIYTSASTISSVGRQRTRSVDEPIYYVPSSRRGSIGSAYSLVASSYAPKRYHHRSRPPPVKVKLHKPLSMYDLHKMKYRSYKGSLAPYNVPL